MTMRLVPALSQSMKDLYPLPWHRLEQKDLPIEHRLLRLLVS